VPLRCVLLWRMTKAPLIAMHFLWRHRGDCRALSIVAHGKGRWLLCVLDYGARQRDVIAVHFRLWRTGKASDCRAFFYRRTAKAVMHRLASAPSVAFFLSCASLWRTTKIVHCALSDGAHGNGTL
jgi:hypothetical protein